MSARATNANMAIKDSLRQMLAVMETERQALAALDLDAIMGCADKKRSLCGQLDNAANDNLDEEARGMLDAARRLNEVNRQIRNLMAANISARLDTLTGAPTLYGNTRPQAAYRQQGATS